MKIFSFSSYIYITILLTWQFCSSLTRKLVPQRDKIYNNNNLENIKFGVMVLFLLVWNWHHQTPVCKEETRGQKEEAWEGKCQKSQEERKGWGEICFFPNWETHFFFSPLRNGSAHINCSLSCSSRVSSCLEWKAREWAAADRCYWDEGRAGPLTPKSHHPRPQPCQLPGHCGSQDAAQCMSGDYELSRSWSYPKCSSVILKRTSQSLCLHLVPLAFTYS